MEVDLNADRMCGIHPENWLQNLGQTNGIRPKEQVAEVGMIDLTSSTGKMNE